MLSPSKGQVAYALLTRSPLKIEPKLNFPFDLHVLGTPPAFVLSQDQTLQYTLLKNRLALNYLIQNFVCLARLLLLQANSPAHSLFLGSCSVFKVLPFSGDLYSLLHFQRFVKCFFTFF